MQLLVAAALAGVAFTIPGPYWLQGSLAFFWLMAFSSATHDIAADGFYMLGLDQHNQAYFVGIRSTFYRIAMIFSPPNGGSDRCGKCISPAYGGESIFRRVSISNTQPNWDKFFAGEKRCKKHLPTFLAAGRCSVL